MEDTNRIVFSLVVETLSLSIATNPEDYFNCLMSSKIIQEQISTWKPLLTIFADIPQEKRLIYINRDLTKTDNTPIITRNMKTYMESVRCYCYLFNLINIENFKVLGFVTDAPIDILNKFTLATHYLYNSIPFKITNYETCRHVQIEETNTNCLSLNIHKKNTNIVTRMIIAPKSEIILGRHAIYKELDIGVVHTSTHNWHIDKNMYFISFITELPNIMKSCIPLDVS